MVATEPEKPRKMLIFKNVGENLEKSLEGVEKHISQGKVRKLSLGYSR